MCLLPYCSLFFALFLSAAQPPTALHATVRSDFVYLASTRTMAAEYWISGDKLYEKRGEQIRIDRRDLGLTWLIDPQKSSYIERKMPPDSPAPPAAAQEDVHTLGFDYQPEFVWDVKDTAETQVLHGRVCRLSVATGIAEFAETTLRLWFCPTAQEDQRRLNNVLVGSSGIRYRGIAGFVASQLKQRPDTALLLMEETTEPPIAPVMKRKVQVGTLEITAPPPGIFDIPPGYQKAPARP
jgi:hypothetical protein